MGLLPFTRDLAKSWVLALVSMLKWDLFVRENSFISWYFKIAGKPIVLMELDEKLGDDGNSGVVCL